MPLVEIIRGTCTSDAVSCLSTLLLLPGQLCGPVLQECKLLWIVLPGPTQVRHERGLGLQVFEATQALSRHMGMQTILSEDRPGFVVNRMLLPLINEAFFLLMEVVAHTTAAV